VRSTSLENLNNVQIDMFNVHCMNHLCDIAQLEVLEYFSSGFSTFRLNINVAAITILSTLIVVARHSVNFDSPGELLLLRRLPFALHLLSLEVAVPDEVD